MLRGPENRGAVGAELETPKASSGEGNGEGVSPPQPTRGSPSAPPAGSGAEPRPKTDFGAF